MFSKSLRLKSGPHPRWHLIDTQEPSPGLKRPGSVADHVTPSIVKLSMRGSISSRPLMHSLPTQGRLYFIQQKFRVRIRAAAIYSQTPYVRVPSEFSHVLTYSPFTLVGTESDKPQMYSSNKCVTRRPESACFTGCSPVTRIVHLI